jgi:pSer/pThr/pTyr-binding forkhead associated (FHA) protein
VVVASGSGGDASPFGATNPQGVPPPPVAPGGKRELVGFLVSYQSDTHGQFWPLYAGRNLVGRAGAADGLDIEINDPHTSSVHAAVHVDSGTRSSHVEDLGSTNGTFYNDEGSPLGPQGRRDLRDNDRVKFGGVSTVVKIVPRV